MRALFFGTSEFAVPSLRVAASHTELKGVVTQPDRPAGRGQRLTPSPVKRAAGELGVRVYEPLRMRDFAREIGREPFDLFLLASYGRILPKELLTIPRVGALNVHPSLLPKYRGATPIQAALRNGDRETGVSIMLMDEGLDTGDLVMSRRVAIAAGETYGELHDRLALAGAELLGEALDLTERGDLPRRAQRGEGSVTRPLAKEDFAVDLSWAPHRVVNLVRSLSPKPAARATIEGESVKILAAHVGDDGELVIDELIAPNRGRMSGAQYLRGRGLA
ncbi:MAG: methionyl-tRNA formyltransferase [Candidatus Eremiobacteraeota bacterium]|nr:methionyl-tRNA formyltransferase [Candidatus Eremiobacteraeota bacterium]MBV9056410.1 methionyl-tRNA formyltransferase [Candidatus Eremiobacteraeota bacterium]MBV9700797.1 methionyl-tRNA formyltransferase [Candidatus Eremiobacteraeota bacterium]